MAINYLGGYRNSMTFVLTGLDIEAKADAGRAHALVAHPRRPRRLRLGRRAAAPHRPRRPGHQRGGPGRAAHHGDGPRPGQGRPGLLEHRHRDGAGQLPRAVHHLAPGRRLQLRRLLAGPGPGRPSRCTRWCSAASARSSSRCRTTIRARDRARVDPSQPRRRWRQRPLARAPAGPAATRPSRPASRPRPHGAGPAVRRPLGRQGRQRQHRRVGPHRRRLRLAAPVPDRRAAPRADAGRDRGPRGRALRAAQPAGRSTS